MLYTCILLPKKFIHTCMHFMKFFLYKQLQRTAEMHFSSHSFPLDLSRFNRKGVLNVTLAPQPQGCSCACHELNPFYCDTNLSSNQATCWLYMCVDISVRHWQGLHSGGRRTGTGTAKPLVATTTAMVKLSSSRLQNSELISYQQNIYMVREISNQYMLSSALG